MRLTGALLGIAFGIILILLLVPPSLFAWGLGQWLWEEHPWLMLALLPVTVVGFVALLDRAKWSESSTGKPPVVQVRRGARLNAIPVAVVVGVLFSAAFLLLLVSGVTGLRPKIVLASGIASACGTLIVLWRH